MELPDHLLDIVRDFSRPVTRPDWRTLKPMSASMFHESIQDTYNQCYLPVIYRFVRRYDQNYYIYHLNGIYNQILTIELIDS